MNELDGDARLPDKRRVIALIQKTLSSGDPFRPPVSTQPQPRSQVQPPRQTAPAQAKAPELPFELPPNFQIDLSLLNSIAEVTAKTSAGSSPIKAAPSKSKHFQPVLLDSAELLKPVPGLHEILYADLPLQCKNCGLRFPDTSDGQERLTAHLDSHFRRNMRLKERSKRVLARDWFGNEEDWRSGRAKTVNHDAQVAIFDNEAALSESEQSSDEFAIVQDEEQDVTCAVCHESIPVEWSDEQEAWIVRKAIQEGDGIVHTHCSDQPAKKPGKKRIRSK